MTMTMKTGLKAVVFGGTGAVGRTLIPQLLESNLWSQVHCVVRAALPEWSQIKNSNKLSIQLQPDMDKLFKINEWKLEGFNSMFVCFGSQVKHGEQTFTKIDKTYPLLCADIAIVNKIPHYLLVSSANSNPNSFFLYMRIKGELEQQLKMKKIPIISILQPGLIKNRPNARTVEKIGQFFSFIPFASIQCTDLGLCLKGIAETKATVTTNSATQVTSYSNTQLLNFVKNYNPPNKTDKKCLLK